MSYQNQNITVLIAARMGSSRFPGKTLAPILGKPMLERLVERIKHSQYIDDIVLATTDLPEDHAIENWCAENGIPCFRGSPSDVLGRLVAASKRFECSTIVEILGDNPLVHSGLIDASVELFFEKGHDYTATVTNEYPKADKELPRFPIGVRVQVFSKETLFKCDELAKLEKNREHATSFIAEHPDIFNTGFVVADGSFAGCHSPNLTFAVNLKKNMELIRNIFGSCYESDGNFDVNDAISLFNTNPEWASLMGNE